MLKQTKKITVDETTLVSEYDLYSYSEAVHYHAHNFLGAKVLELNKTTGVQFTVYMPQAKSISLVSDFNSWQDGLNDFKRIGDSNFWILWVEGIGYGTSYQFLVHLLNGETKLMNDPYARQVIFDSRLASVVTDTENYQWNDTQHLEMREQASLFSSPMISLAVDLATYSQSSITYQEIAKDLVEKAKKYSATHIELKSFLEEITDFTNSNESLVFKEYQFFSPALGFGRPEDFQCLINYLHQNGISVVLDLPFFELNNIAIAPNMKVLLRKPYKNFYLSSIIYWLEQYHIDGFRFSSLDSLLGSHPSDELLEFIQLANEVIQSRSKGAFAIAEDSSSYPSLTESISNDGLGFAMKLNHDLQNDVLSFFNATKYKRDYDLLSYTSIYSFADRHILNLDADIKLKARKSIDKLNDMKFLLSFFFTYPGKKYFSLELIENFRSIVSRDSVSSVDNYFAALTEIYSTNASFYETDFRAGAFEWISTGKDNCLAFLRWSRDYKTRVLVMMNFSDEFKFNQRIGVPQPGFYKELLNSDAKEFGGSGLTNEDGVYSSNIGSDDRANSVVVDLAPNSVVIFASC